MNKDEILRASRKENRNKDIWALEVQCKGQRIAFMVAVAVVVALIIIEYLIFDCEVNYGYLCIVFSSITGLWLYNGIKLKKKRGIAFAVICGILGIYSFIEVILNCIG